VSPDAPLVAVTDHAVERYRQRVPRRTGAVDVRPEIAGRVAEAWAARHARSTGLRPAEPCRGERGTMLVHDLVVPSLVYICRHDVPRGELVVITVWEEGEGAAVPRRFTDALG
jgi:hypothetical protein